MWRNLLSKSIVMQHILSVLNVCVDLPSRTNFAASSCFQTRWPFLQRTFDSILFVTKVNLSHYRTRLLSPVFATIEVQLTENDLKIGEIFELAIMFCRKVFSNQRLPQAHDPVEPGDFQSLVTLAGLYGLEQIDDEHPILCPFSLLYDESGNWLERNLAHPGLR
jgi:hypothetical protein